MEKELLGYAAVDSGQLLIVDPCYLGEWRDGEYGDRDNNYNECCEVTLSDRKGGPVLRGFAVVFESGYGDGTYPVYCRRNGEGRIVEVIVDLLGGIADTEEEEEVREGFLLGDCQRFPFE